MEEIGNYPNQSLEKQRLVRDRHQTERPKSISIAADQPENGRQEQDPQIKPK